MTEITTCGRTIAGGYVAFDIQWAGQLPDDRAVLWSMTVTSTDGAETVELGLLLGDDGTQLQFVDDDVTGRRSEVPVNADVKDQPDGEGGEVTVRFPAEVVGVAVEWPVWRAVLAVDGQQVSERVANTT